jgi:hypothetical protein
MLNKHRHEFPIKDELQKRLDEWSNIFEKVQSLKKIIDENYYQHEHLVKCLDKEKEMKKNDLPVEKPAHYVDEDV